MGCDIHSCIEHKQPDGSWKQVTDVIPLDDFDKRTQEKERGDSPFDWRAYGMFGFLADVRNYSHVPTVAEPKHAIPEDTSQEVKEAYEFWSGDAHTATWLTVRQLSEFDYDQIFWNRRVTKNGDGAALADEGEGEHLSIREFLGDAFFEHLKVLQDIDKNPDDVRVVFWFDN